MACLRRCHASGSATLPPWRVAGQGAAPGDAGRGVDPLVAEAGAGGAGQGGRAMTPGTGDMAAAAAPSGEKSAQGGGKPKESPVQWQTEMNTVYQGGVDERREAMDADKIEAKKDYGHLYSHFDYETMGKWLQQTCRQPVSDASGAFVARALELLLRDTIDNVLEIARVRQNQPKAQMFEGTELEVVDSGVNIREKLAAMAKNRAALAKESTAQLATVAAAAAKEEEKWGALADQNKAVASSIAMIDRKRKQVGSATTAQRCRAYVMCS